MAKIGVGAITNATIPGVGKFKVTNLTMLLSLFVGFVVARVIWAISAGTADKVGGYVAGAAGAAGRIMPGQLQSATVSQPSANGVPFLS